MYNPLDSVIEYNDPNELETHWQLPSTPLQLIFNTKYIDSSELKLITQELDLNLTGLESLEVYVERTEGQLDYILINDIRYECAEDLPSTIKSFLDNIQFGDPEDPIITTTGERINFWDVLSGQPEIQQAFFSANYRADTDYFYIDGNYEVVDPVISMEQKLNIKMEDGLKTQIITQQVNDYIETQNENKQKKRKSYLTITLLCLSSLLIGAFALWGKTLLILL